MKKYLEISSFLLCMLLASTARSQRYLGIATSDWASIYSLYLNPASIADCREKMSINVLSLNAAVDNNLGPIPKIPDMGNTINNSSDIFLKSRKKNFSMMAPAAVLRGPGIMISLGRKTSIAFTSGIRAINQFHNFDPALYKVFADVGSLPTGNYTAKAQNFNWTAHLWSEIGLSVGTVVSEGDKHRLNFGVTVRRLGGIGYITIAGRNIDLDYKMDANSFSAANSDIVFSSNVLNDSSKAFKNITPGGLFNKFFGETAGSGISTDIGFTYRYRIGEPEPSDYMESDLTHDIILSVAVTDLGAIRYYNSTSAVINIKGAGNLADQDLKGKINNIQDAVNYAHQHGFSVDTLNTPRKVYLPTALVASADVQVHGRFLVNLLYVGNLADRGRFGNSYYNQLSLTPRYDYHKMTIAIPITYSTLAYDFKIGAAVRYGGFFVGSDDLAALFKRRQFGFGVYFGGYIPIFKKNNDPIGLHWKT